ncbi:TRAP transporter large permease subunit [Clostridium sp. MCC353]|uniref:SLC13 family permease n=1 Tax=Clostridium sp. MCC353 TaxID=2592646 RepID=UPI001C0284B8|nr:SLC13 family permease [Clostridium sp. MCC353]MBT9778684.1 TRAP transporter large permease subunit [Clostridium sp. MCC353]
MGTTAILTLIILIATTLGFIFNIAPGGLVSMTAAIALALVGAVSPADVFSPMGGTTVALVMTMIVLGYALFHVGVAKKMAQAIVKIVGKSESRIMIAVVIVALILSAVCSGVAVVAVLLPIVISICLEANISVSRQLIPLSFAASIGCNLTLVGAASNVVVAGVLENADVPFLSFFELGKVGLPLCILFIIYFLLIGKRLLRNGDTSNQEYIQRLTAKSKDDENFNTRKASITVIVLAAVFVAMALDLDRFPMYFVAGIGVVVLRLTNCINEKEFFESIDLSTLFIVSGLMTLATGVSKSGLAAAIANGFIAFLGDNPSKMIVLLAVLVITCILTNLMSNTGAAALLTPVFLPIAQTLGVNPVAIGVAICVGASMPFLTPYGSGTNTLLIAPGNLTVRDFFVPGIGLTIVSIIGSMIFIPLAFPL